MLNWRTKKPSQNVQPKYSDCHGDKDNRQTYFRVIQFNDKEQFKKKSNRVITAQYGILSFLPLFTIDQLIKFTNQYFLFISILQQIPDASPVGRFTTILPLTIKFGFSAIKSIIKDLIKHIRDYKVNHRCVEVLRNGVLVQERWSEIGIGDIIKVKNNNIIPADLVLLSSSELQGTCHIETKHLDGEVNLKIRQCVKETSYCKELKDLIGLNGIIECELPNKLLYNFLGRLTIMNNNPIPLDNKQFLLRGSVLRNSKWIYGVVVYSGHETKIMLNQSISSLKESAMETIHNSLLKTVFVLIFFLSLMCALCSLCWTKHNINKHWYLEQRDVNAYTFLLQSISFFVIFHNTIPVSYVYIEVVRFLQDLFINNDIDMYQEESNIPARVRSHNLNVELAKVKYIFSDKTGTLTKNVMKLKHCSIAGELYLEGSQNKMINIKHIRDYKVNHRCVEVLRNGVLVQERWSEIGIGDIIKVKNNNIIPADLVLLSSSELQGTCHIETKHLDGEVNLKIRQCVKETSYCKELKDLIGLNGIIECELPNKLLYNFLGRLTIMNNNPIPLDNKQFLLRGSVLRNSKWIYGVVVYSGHETKIMLNQSISSLKESAMETIHNSLLKTVFVLIFFLSLMCALCSLCWTKHNINKHWYLEQRDVNAYTFLLQSISFFVIFHNTIPVSYVYIEVVRFLQDLFINNDIDMYQEESNIPARVRSHNLNVELAKVKYIFSDKTGTLTKNVMKLKHCSIAGELYLEGSQNKMINIKHIRDYKVNHRCVEVLRNGVLVQERWSEIGIGDIIKVKNNNIIPADLVLLSSSELQGTCHIETKHLDGEVNLKIRQCVKETSYCKELKDLIGLNGIIECELPNKLLYNFLGRLTIMNNNPIPLDNKQFLLRGSVLRNSKWIYGVVVYSGHETKIMLNQSISSLKESAMETIHNSLLKTVFVLIFFLSLMCALCSLCWTKHNINKHWYLEQRDVNAYTFLLQSISFFVIFHNTIPVSYVYIEVVRFLQDWFINNDIDMYQEESNIPARVRSHNLNVELAKVKYIFSDKTGTLTKNVMKLKHCSIAGELYLEGSQNKMINNSINHSTKNYILDFLRIMSVCHTVIPEKSKLTDEIVYNASSPDEQALVIGSQQFGFTFHTRCSTSVTITTLNGEETYEILNIIEFTNSRKRMSVIVRAPDGQIQLFCKGADTGIIKRLSKSGEKYKHQSLMHLNDFARSGYRTLCFAYKNISESFYNKWKDEYLKASTVLINRESAKNKVAEKIEKKLTLIGVTAIENKLQDNVPKTIQALMCAAIKIWILTGDKEETALNIGFSTTLITQDSSIIIFNESNLMDLRHTINQKIYNLGLTVEITNCTLIISGRLLKHALSSDLKMKFLKLCLDCKSVICYRISPTQKAEIVDLVTKYTNEVTLAIGDGANDVPMLHNASIGVGVVGLDGLQAYNASDYSIAQFNHLLKLLFVHGAWNYEKITKMIYFYHYKTVIFNSLQLWFAIYSGWSGQVLFDRWNIFTYKSLFTVSLPIVMGLFLTTCSTETRLKCPQLYYQTQNVFNFKMFWIWIVNALFHSLLLFWLCLFIMRHEVIWTKGRVGDYSVFGNVIYTCTLIIVCFKSGLHIQSWSLIVDLAIWVSILLWILFIIAYNELKIILMHFTVFINVNEIIFSSSIFWITIIFTASVVLLLDIVIITIQQTLSNDTKNATIKKNGNLEK